LRETAAPRSIGSGAKGFPTRSSRATGGSLVGTFPLTIETASQIRAGQVAGKTWKMLRAWATKTYAWTRDRLGGRDRPFRRRCGPGRRLYGARRAHQLSVVGERVKTCTSDARQFAPVRTGGCGRQANDGGRFEGPSTQPVDVGIRHRLGSRTDRLEGLDARQSRSGSPWRNNRQSGAIPCITAERSKWGAGRISSTDTPVGVPAQRWRRPGGSTSHDRPGGSGRSPLLIYWQGSGASEGKKAWYRQRRDPGGIPGRTA